MQKRSRWIFITVALGCTAVLVAGLIILTASGGKPPPVPSPNGYDDFAQAGKVLHGDPGTFRNLDENELSDLISANAESLRLVRAGLTRKCRMPPNSMQNVSGLLPQLAEMKRLAFLFAAEGQLEELRHQPGKAALIYTEAIHFGNEMSRGGPLITRLVGIACESLGGEALKKVAPRLSGDEAAKALARLAAIDHDRVTWTEVMASERLCASYQRQTLSNPITWLASSVLGWWHSRAALAKAEVRHQMITANERLLMTDLALRSFQARNGALPGKLDELVTNYLATVPQDPFAQGPIIYRTQPGGNWVVYSVGPDGQDDGGQPAGRGWPIKGDLVIGATENSF